MLKKQSPVWAALAVAACGGGDAATGWNLDASVARAGEGIPFCEEAMAGVVEHMSQFNGQMPPSDEYGGTVVIGSIGEIADGMNALVSADYTANQHQLFVNLMTLIQYDAEYAPVPYLAESWEVNEDETEITWRLRDDVYWHDGERTDAYDVAFTYRTAIHPETGFPNSTFWTYYDKSDTGIEVVDSLTVKIRLEPHSDYLDAWRTVAIMPEHLLGDVPPSELKQHPFGSVCPVGNGPFIFTQHRQDASWTFQPNPEFPEALGGRPYVDRYVYRIINEQNTLLADLLTENIDVYISVKPDQAEAVEAEEHLRLLNYAFRNYIFVGWNSRKPQLADKRVRQAVTLATDRQAIVDALIQGYGVIANGTIPRFHWAYDAQAGDMPFDPDRARQLLDEAGWTDRDGDGVRENAAGTRLSISIKYNDGNDIRRDVSQIMQSQLADVGIEVTPEVREWATLLNDINVERDFDGVVMGWVVEFKLDDLDLFHSERIDGPYAYSGTQRPDIDELLMTLARSTDRDEALPLWAEYQELLRDEQPYTFIYFPDRLDGVNRRVEGVHMDVRGEWLNIKDWRIPPEGRRGR